MAECNKISNEVADPSPNGKVVESRTSSRSSSKCSNPLNELESEYVNEDVEQQNNTIKTTVKRRYYNRPTDSRNSSPCSRLTDTNNGEDSCKEHSREKRTRCHSNSSTDSVETDPAVLARRQKQIDYGKNTAAYENYLDTVPKSKRTRQHPHTPNKYRKYSRRAFDGLIKVWRKQLHKYDPPNPQNENGNTDSDSDSD